ncbi:hypothetical protein BTO30_04340 [Domibacillus antri]|uniref:YprB ribonuclease H-like domain-containing protein n=1 Tax=Domibacillus antri TaxID=1714264 RepID=A0A1Q8Q786_9BACI|nr:ribonuclease H-like domain-containing protein [Domibacillus antri]OLN23208.1 hypothetical protein BTO30_04340 [Domibacillus antri]
MTTRCRRKVFHRLIWFFFDIETTGLSRTGSVIFLLGTARLIGNQVTVKQYFLPALPAFGHFDLYHASRRLFKHTMKSVKLVNVGKELLGLERVDDVPGHLAPIIYFDYVDRGDPEGVLQVMKHNERDILSLLTLYTHISRLVLDESFRNDDRTALEVAKWFESSGNHAAAQNALKQPAGHSESEVALEAAYRLALQWKWEKAFEEAAALFKRVGESECTRAFDAAIELAKLYEHRWKQFGDAIESAEQALLLTDDAVKKRRSFTV